MPSALLAVAHEPETSIPPASSKAAPTRGRELVCVGPEIILSRCSTTLFGPSIIGLPSPRSLDPLLSSSGRLKSATDIQPLIIPLGQRRCLLASICRRYERPLGAAWCATQSL